MHINVTTLNLKILYTTQNKLKYLNNYILGMKKVYVIKSRLDMFSIDFVALLSLFDSKIFKNFYAHCF